MEDIHDYKKWWEDYKLGKHLSERYKSSVGSKGLSKITSYGDSKYFIRYSSSLDSTARIITKAVKTTRDMIVILDFPFKIRVCLNGEDIIKKDKYRYEGDWKNSRRIFIPTNAIDDDSLNEVEKINIICGGGIHESTHLRYTEALTIFNFKKKLILDNPLDKLTFLLANVLEDERVEDLLLTNRPGFLDFLKSFKDYNTKLINLKLSHISKDKNDVQKIVDTVIKLIRCPEKVDNEIINSHNKFFIEISEVINEKLINTKDSCEKAIKIKSTIFNYLVSELKIDTELVTSKIKSYLNSTYDRYFIEVNSGNDQEIDVNISKKNMSSEVTDESSGRILSNLVNGISELGESKDVYFTKITNGNKDTYLKDKKTILGLIPSIKKIIVQTDKNYKFNIYGCRSGLLDTNKLAEAYQDIPQVYVKQGEVRTNKTTICVLIDESGSMCSKSKFEKARLSAVLLNEALGKINGVDLYIYGHTADKVCTGSVDINIYREGKTFNPKFSLSNVTARSENRDGPAILETAKRVRKFTKERCLMFVISDGCPCAVDYYGSEAISDVKENVKKAEKLDFDIFQISIDEVDRVEEMFDKFTEIFDLANLPSKLGNLIKKSILENKKTVIV